jgi:hypothetical protein
MSVSENITLKDRMTDKLEGSSYGIIKILSCHLPGGIEETIKNTRIAAVLPEIYRRHLPNTD